MNRLDSVISNLTITEQLKVINDLSVFFVNEPEIKRRQCVFEKLLFKLKIQLENVEDYKENVVANYQNKEEKEPVAKKPKVITATIKEPVVLAKNKESLYSIFSKD